MHLAASLGIPVVSLFFSTHYVETGPYGAGHYAIHPDISCFPCQGTGKCPHKECLGFISPGTVEAAVLHCLAAKENTGSTRLKKINDRVRIFVSTFDPWRNLDWVPLDGHPIVFREYERFLLKATWLYYTDIIRDNDDREPEYLRRVLKKFENTSVNGGLTQEIEAYHEKLSTFRTLLKKAQNISIDVQSELLNSRIDHQVVKPLGEKLTQSEEELTQFDSDSSIGFLGELLTVFLENIPKSYSLDLSSKTINLYRDVASIIDGIMSRSTAIAATLEKGA